MVNAMSLVEAPYFKAATSALEKLVAITLEVEVRIVHALALDSEILNQMVLANAAHLLYRLGTEKIVHVQKELKGNIIVLLAAKTVQLVNIWMYRLVTIDVN